jgi:eukaryotic-like serine/threonine-protein kinase
MTPERWLQAKALLSDALERSPDTRAAWLAGACADDVELRQEVESLLEAYDAAGTFIESPAADVRNTAPNDVGSAEQLIGRRLGAYRIVRLIGRGGMGIVYCGVRDDGHYQQEVAIKLVAMGVFSDLARHRFQQEREILAGLEHPYIARLLDAGTSEDGMPYFVMELVDGVPLDVYCDKHQLSLTNRLRLVRRVCEAVQYAHQQLVVHRDLKPTNVLVTDEGLPKLLDFGIAKLLGEGAQSGMTLPIMTPEYASPEQIRGEAISTTTDVYSLGVLVYRLLTARSPYEASPDRQHDFAHAICEVEPQPPSMVSAYSFRHRLAGDVDAIVLKALRKEPSRRYASVEQFSEDIRHFLTGQPVTARRDTVTYRAGKFVRRHRAASIGAMLVLLTLVGGVAATSWQAGVARAERARAERRFNDVRKLANSILFDIHNAISDLPGATSARELVVKKALEYLDSLAREAGDDMALRHELATAYMKIASIEANVSDTTAALASYQKALAILGDPRGADRSEHRKTAGAIHLALARLSINRGDDAAAVRHFRAGVETLEELSRRDPADFVTRRELAEGYKGLGDIAGGTGDLQAGLRHYRRTLEIGQEMVALNAADNNGRALTISAYDAIATTLGNPNFINLGDTSAALDYQRRLLEFITSRLRDDPNSAYLLISRAYSLKALGEMLTVRGDWAEALGRYNEAMAVWQRLAQLDPRNVYVASRLAYTLSNIGEAQAALGRYAESFESHHDALARLTALTAKDAGDSLLRTYLARAQRKYGDVLMHRGRRADAVRAYTQAVAIDEPLARANPADMDIRYALAADYSSLGAALRGGSPPAARTSTVGADAQQEFCRRFRQSRDVYLEMRAHKLSTPPLEKQLTNVLAELQRCDAATPATPVARTDSAR